MTSIAEPAHWSAPQWHRADVTQQRKEHRLKILGVYLSTRESVYTN